MKSNLRLTLLFCFLITNSIELIAQSNTLNIGDEAPPLKLGEWLKGKPIDRFEKGKIYVVEFWATWCGPCRAAIPRLSKLARKYKNKAVFIGIDVYEDQLPLAYRKSISQIQAFVDSMGRGMKYKVAVGDSNFMETTWLKASGEQGIPTGFVINAEGRVAWMGHPMYLDKILPKILNKDWDINKALARYLSDKNLDKMDSSLNDQLVLYNGNANIFGDFGKPDSALLMLEEWTRKEPRLKFAPNTVFNIFSALLKTDQHKAYEYGKEVLTAPTEGEPANDRIISVIEWWSDKITLQPEIYELGAEAFQSEINHIPYPEIANIPKLYNKMAAWYWRANNKTKAIYADRQAIKAMKKKRV